MIEWKHVLKNQPEEDALVWVVLCHWKERKPGSYEINKGVVKVVGGEVESFQDKSSKRNWRVNTCDDDGCGSHCFYPYGHVFLEDEFNHLEEVFFFWCYDFELNIPKGN